MPTFFSRVFRSKDTAGSAAPAKAGDAGDGGASSKRKRWPDAWVRAEVEADEVQRLIRACTSEVKSRALDIPFLLLPFRPGSDPAAAKTLVRNYFNSVLDRDAQSHEQWLQQELRLCEPMVLCSVLKWCWSRLVGGVVTWEAYELFKIGEQDSNMARDAFATFIPLSVDTDSRTKIIFDFFDLLAAIAAHGKINGLGGRKVSRLAGWWAFAHIDSGEGFDDGYKSWARAADATSHLFFAYLRSLSPGFVPGADAILSMPRSLQALLQATEYPPETPTLMQHESAKVIMIVDTVSPTPFALLRRAKHFDYRDDDRALQAFAAFDDPVEALTEESRRVVRCISSINQSHVPSSTTLTGLRDGEWSRFEDIGFSSLIEDPAHASGSASPSTWSSPQQQQQQQPPLGLRSAPQSQGHAQGRPTTPSWADFLSAGFVEGGPNQSVVPHLLPPDKVLPPIGMTRAHTAQPATTAPTDADGEAILEPGELASITLVNLDASFWWVWMTSLAAEEPPARKAVFGRCAVVETGIAGGRWLVMEEKVKGAAPLPVEGAHIVEKKSRFSLTKRGRGISWRGKTSSKNQPPPPPPLPSPYANSRPAPASKVSIGPDQHARIQAAASALQQKQKQQQQRPQADHARRARTEDVLSTKTNSVFTLQPIIMKEAAPAMQWANRFDHDNVRDTYLSDEAAGRGQSRPTPTAHATSDRDLPALPQERRPSAVPPQPPSPDRKVLPSETRSPSTETPPFASPRQDAEAPPAGGPQLDSQARPTEQYFPSPAGFEAVPPPYCREQSPPPESSSRPEPPPSQPEHYSTTRPTEAAEVHLPNGGLAPDSPEARKAHKRLQKRSADRVGGGAGAGLMRIFGKKSLERPSSRPTQEESWSFVDVSSPSDASVGAGAGVDDRRPSEPRSTTSQHEPMPVSENAGAPEVMDRRRPEPPALERLETQQQQPPPKLTNAGPASDSPLPPQSPPYAPQQLDEVPAYATEPNCGAAPDSPTSPLGPPARASNERVADGFSEAIEVDRSYDVSRSSSPGTDAAPAPVIAPARRQAPVAASTPAPASTRRASPAAAAAAAAAMAAASSSSSLSSQSQQPAQQQPSQPPPPDRWAQIRKNAAERAAKRISVDPSRPVGGETNGEESIESRVARIKARVAELTGSNAEGENKSRPAVQ